jgi:hypothetical protein
VACCGAGSVRASWGVRLPRRAAGHNHLPWLATRRHQRKPRTGLAEHDTLPLASAISGGGDVALSQLTVGFQDGLLVSEPSQIIGARRESGVKQQRSLFPMNSSGVPPMPDTEARPRTAGFVRPTLAPLWDAHRRGVGPGRERSKSHVFGVGGRGAAGLP